MGKVTRAWLALALTLCACNPVERLRQALRDGDPNDMGNTNRPTQIVVEVVPPEGISVMLDGNKVATASPYQSGALTPGTHTLEVRGMGYMTVQLPVEIGEHQSLKVPVSLRPRPSIINQEEANLPPVVDPQPRPVIDNTPKEPPKPSPQAPGPDLPALVPPVPLHLACQPEAPVVLDGIMQTGKSMTLRRQWGAIQIGVMWMNYNLTSNRTLELSLPDDGATWHRDANVVKGGSTLRLSHGFTRVRREAKDGTDQSVVIRRID